MARFLTDPERRTLAAAADRIAPPLDEHPGAAALGVVDYVEGLLTAFDHDPPRIHAGGPFSGRHGGEASFADFLPLSRLETLAWRIRIEGTQGDPAREFNGPVVGFQERYRTGLAALGADFADVDPDTQDRRLAADEAFRTLLHEHTCEACYGDPVYGGNRDGAGWRAIRFAGDVQPRGYTDAEVSGRD